MSAQREMSWAMTIIFAATVLAVAFMASQVVAQPVGPTTPLTNGDVRAILDEMRRDNSDKFNLWMVTFGSAVIAALLAGLRILWASLRKAQVALADAQSVTIREIKDAADDRQNLYSHIEKIMRDNLVTQAKSQAAITELAAVISRLRENCETRTMGSVPPVVGDI